MLRKIISDINPSAPKSSPAKAADDLTKRELEVLHLVASGLSNEEIAEKMHISVTTVKGHRSNLLLKTGTKNSAGLVMFAIKNNIIHVGG